MCMNLYLAILKIIIFYFIFTQALKNSTCCRGTAAQCSTVMLPIKQFLLDSQWPDSRPKGLWRLLGFSTSTINLFFKLGLCLLMTCRTKSVFSDAFTHFHVDILPTVVESCGFGKTSLFSRTNWHKACSSFADVLHCWTRFCLHLSLLHPDSRLQDEHYCHRVDKNRQFMVWGLFLVLSAVRYHFPARYSDVWLRLPKALQWLSCFLQMNSAW